MLNVTLTKQYIRDITGKPIAVILPIEEYQALTQVPVEPEIQRPQPARSSLYGALHHPGGVVAPTEILDQTRRELWSTWNRTGETP